MGTVDLTKARRDAKQTAQLAVRMFVRQPSIDTAQTVSLAWERVRMLDELRSCRNRAGGGRRH